MGENGPPTIANIAISMTGRSCTHSIHLNVASLTRRGRDYALAMHVKYCESSSKRKTYSWPHYEGPSKTRQDQTIVAAGVGVHRK